MSASHVMTRGKFLRDLAAFVAGSPFACAQRELPYAPDRMPQMDELVNVFEFEPVCKARIPKQNFDFISLGVDYEWTLRRNRDAFDRLELRPRMLVKTADLDLSTTLFGTKVNSPIIVAPTAGHQLAHPDGEIATAKGAAAAGSIMCLSNNSSYPMERVAEATNSPKWFQLYAAEDMDTTRERVLRAADAGFQLICLTVDLPFSSHRERTFRNRALAGVPGRSSIRRRRPDEDPRPPHPYRLRGQLILSSLDWSFIEQLRKWTKLPLLVKGILTPEDAELAVKYGFDGVVVSNHGGRALDYAPATIEVLPEIVQAASGRLPILIDSGFRRGTDLLKALALGASAVLIGRPVLWGLGAYGSAGVERVLQLLESELALAMALSGKPNLKSLDRSLVRIVSESR